MGLERKFTTHFYRPQKQFCSHAQSTRKESGIRLIRNANGYTFSLALEGTGFLKEADALADAGQQVRPSLHGPPGSGNEGEAEADRCKERPEWLQAMSVSQPQNI